MADNITVSSNGTNEKVSVTADTSQYWSEKSREWAISDELVGREDYSSKYYAKKSKEASDVATGAIDDIEASKAEFDSSYNTKSQALNTQYTGYVTELETQKTEAITDIESKTEGLADLYDEYTENLTTQETQAIQNIATKETQSIANVGSKETESVANITAVGEATIESITTVKNSALADINTADGSALSDISTALEEAKQEINDTKTGAIDDIINNAAGEALERIEQIETETTKTITDTANNAVSTINTAVTTGQNEINDTVTTSKQELNTIIKNADTDLTNKINAANTDLTDKVTSAENSIKNTAANATTAITNAKDTAIETITSKVTEAETAIDTKVSTAQTNIETTADTAISELNTIVSTANTTIDSKVTNVTNMETHVTELEANAESSAELARKYAENPEDVPVIEGEYSAKHWAAKAEGVANVLENPMKNDMSNITETGVDKIKEIAGTVTPDIDVSNLANINLSNITIDGEKKIVQTMNKAVEIKEPEPSDTPRPLTTMSTNNEDYDCILQPPQSYWALFNSSNSWGLVYGASFMGLSTPGIVRAVNENENSEGLIYIDEDPDFTDYNRYEELASLGGVLTLTVGKNEYNETQIKLKSGILKIQPTQPQASDFDTPPELVPIFWVDNSDETNLKVYEFHLDSPTLLTEITTPWIPLAKITGVEGNEFGTVITNITYEPFKVGVSVYDLYAPAEPDPDALPECLLARKDLANLTAEGADKIKDIVLKSMGAYVTEVYRNGTSGYILYSNKLCIQWGVSPNIESAGSAIVNLLAAYADTNYCILLGNIAAGAFNPGAASISAANNDNEKTTVLFKIHKIWSGTNYVNNTYWQTIGYIA